MSSNSHFPYKRIIPSLPSVTERYFSPRFAVNVNGVKNNDQCVLFHSNKLGVVTLAPSHPILRENKVVRSISFQVNEKVNRIDNQVSGKKKRGGQQLQANAVLCKVICADETEYQILSCIKGTLIEVNEILLEKTSLLTDLPWSNGYIAIVMVPLRESETIQEKLMSAENYIAMLEKSKEEVNQSLVVQCNKQE